MIDYSPFWTLLKVKGIKITHLSRDHHINPKTIQAMRENKPISMRTADDLCQILECNIEDIVKISLNTPGFIHHSTGAVISMEKIIRDQKEKDKHLEFLLKYINNIYGSDLSIEELKEFLLGTPAKTSKNKNAARTPDQFKEYAKMKRKKLDEQD